MQQIKQILKRAESLTNMLSEHIDIYLETTIATAIPVQEFEAALKGNFTLTSLQDFHYAHAGYLNAVGDERVNGIIAALTERDYLLLNIHTAFVHIQVLATLRDQYEQYMQDPAQQESAEVREILEACKGHFLTFINSLAQHSFKWLGITEPMQTYLDDAQCTEVLRAICGKLYEKMGEAEVITEQLERGRKAIAQAWPTPGIYRFDYIIELLNRQHGAKYTKAGTSLATIGKEYRKLLKHV